MRFGSVCSGIEAASTAWTPIGWEAAWFAEIEPFPCAVLKHHYPHVPNYGDMTKFKDWNAESIDLLCGGTPCQSFSVAGLRKGLDDPRGNLMLTFGAIADHFRPKWLVWENVPGVLSSNGGRDFGSFLWMLGKLGYGFAYRVLDAQYFGVPQRRRRVFVVGCIGDWRSAAAVLFERHSLQGNIAPCREAWKEVTGTIGSRASSGGGFGTDFECAGGLQPWPAQVATTLDANFGDKMGLENQHINGGGHSLSLARCLTTKTRIDAETETLIPTNGGRFVDAQPIAIQGTLIGRAENSGPQGVGASQDGIMYTLTKADVHGVAHPITQYGEIAGSLTARHDSSPCADRGMNVVAQPIAFHVDAQPDQMTFSAETTASLTCSQRAGVVQPMYETLYNKGLTQGDLNASAQETNATPILRTLLQEIGEETFAKWGLGILNSLQSKEILQQALHGISVRPAPFSRSWVVYCSLSRSEDDSTWLLQSLREAGCPRCTSQGWQPPEQLARELRAYMSELSQPGTQAKRFMHDLWWAAQGTGILREALSTIQKMGRSSYSQDQPAHGGMQVRRLTVEECEFLQGFPRGYTNIPWRGKPESPDGPRYKALGNSWAVPVVRWIGERINQVEAIK